ncbi:hypothetical protein ACFOWA_20010 [Pedobacter lithocola]|uniref:Uncharacterized protein n=1 Tax=Pedobacter lithocola TaxID=1908239 RepID=A0ABV8PDT2_9SPHI
MSKPEQKRAMPKGLKAKSLTYTALIGISRVVKTAFIIASCSILLIELVLVRFAAPTFFIYSLGTIYLKGCYAVFGSVIFYFINIQIPKEKKKFKSSLYVTNRITKLIINLDFIQDRLELDRHPKAKLNLESFTNAVAKTDPDQSVQTFVDTNFKNWAEFLEFLKQESNSTLKDLLLIQDVVDSDILEYLIKIENIFNLMTFYEIGVSFHPARWKMMNIDFHGIWYNKIKVQKALAKSYTNTLKQHHEKHYKEQVLPNLK